MDASIQCPRKFSVSCRLWRTERGTLTVHRGEFGELGDPMVRFRERVAVVLRFGILGREAHSLTYAQSLQSAPVLVCVLEGMLVLNFGLKAVPWGIGGPRSFAMTGWWWSSLSVVGEQWRTLQQVLPGFCFAATSSR